MNSRLDQLHSYPFQKPRELFAGVTPNAGFAPVNPSIGEPKHATPEFIKQALNASMAGLENHPLIQDAGASAVMQAGNGRSCAEIWICHA